MRSKIKFSLVLAFVALSILPIAAQSTYPIPETEEELHQLILQLDSLFWQAYNTCDADKMGEFLTDDIEFYHDKGGLTETKEVLLEGLRTGLCGNPDMHLRREAVKGTVEVFPMSQYGAIISGKHLFYVVPTGKEEFLDGLARFTHLWQYKEGYWKMARVLSYDHGPAPAGFENK